MMVVSTDHPKSGEEPKSAGQLVLELVSAIAGFAAFLSALMLYFGYTYTSALFGYFGIMPGVLGLGSTDYLLRSAEVVFRPVVFATLLLALIIGLAWSSRKVEADWAAFAISGILWSITFIGPALALHVFLQRDLPAYLGASGLVCSGAAILVLHNMRNRQTFPSPYVPVLIIGTLLAAIGAFWLMSNYAAYLGTHRAECITKGECALPDAFVYTKEFLVLPGGQDQTGRKLAPWGYMYSGFKVLTYANDRWFLIQLPCEGKQPCSDTTLSPTVILPDEKDSILVRVQPLRRS